MVIIPLNVLDQGKRHKLREVEIDNVGSLKASTYVHKALRRCYIYPRGDCKAYLSPPTIYDRLDYLHTSHACLHCSM
jgi:hypothetical protein